MPVLSSLQRARKDALQSLVELNDACRRWGESKDSSLLGIVIEKSRIHEAAMKHLRSEASLVTIGEVVEKRLLLEDGTKKRGPDER